MKITPIEIRQKTFEKDFRGYNRDEVEAFLISLSNEWERMIDENKEYKIKLDIAEKEVQKLREVESSLFKTLKTAEDTGANLIDHATRTAELHLKESHITAESMLNDARVKSRSLIEKAEMQARQTIDEMQDSLRNLEENYKMLLNHRENLLSDIKTFTSDILERVEKTSKQHQNESLDFQQRKARSLVRDFQELKMSTDKIDTIKIAPPQFQTPKSASKNLSTESTVIQKHDKKEAVGKSFFDELDDHV